MAFNTRNSAEKRLLVNPKDMRFTHADIKYSFTDPTYPTVRDTASLIRRGLLNPHALGPLHVSIDQQGTLWCDNNRRLFALRSAGVDSVTVVFDGTRRPNKSSKSKLSDPDFMPTIRGEAWAVQIPPPPTSGQNGYRMQKESSPLGSASAGYWKRQFHNSYQDEEDEDELEDRFTRLAIKRNDPDQRRIRGGSSGVQIPPPPTSGRNACQMKKETSLQDPVSAGYSKRQLHKSHQYEKEGIIKDKRKVGYCVSAFPWEKEAPLKNKGKVEYCVSAFSIEKEVPLKNKGKVEYCVSAFSCEEKPPLKNKGKVEYCLSGWISCEDESDDEFGYLF